MSIGLYSRDVVAAWLRKRVDEVERMIREDGLPAVSLPSAGRTRYKFSATHLAKWMSARSNVIWDATEIRRELDAVIAQRKDKEEVEA